MNETKALELLQYALNSLREEKRLPEDVNERTLTHRLALHLEAEVRKCDRSEVLGVDPSEVYVDCEYNRVGDVTTKKLFKLSERIQQDAGANYDWPTDTKGRTVYPDIIVHKRGKDGPNLMVIEVKRTSASTPDIELDRMKLRCFQEELRYKHAFLVKLSESEPTVEPVKIARASE
jgi:hypothetical protein